jgi:hypothetical protein
LKVDQLFREHSRQVDSAGGPNVRPHVAAVGPAQLGKLLREAGELGLSDGIVFVSKDQHADPSHALALRKDRGAVLVDVPSLRLVLQLRTPPQLRYFELGHSKQAHQRRKIGRCGELDSVSDLEIDFGEDLGLGRWRPHSREKGSIPSRSLVFTVGHA